MTFLLLLTLVSTFILVAARSSPVVLPATVTAGVAFPVTIAWEPQQREREQQDGDTLRLYLANHRKYNGFVDRMCFLSDRLPINTTLTNLTIPPESGPNASDYQLYIDGLNGRGGSLFGPSEDFSLEGSNVSSWSPVELHGALGIYDAMPCSAMQCNRSCKERWVATATRKDGFWSNQEYCECIVGCPGVTTENPYYGGGDGCGWEWRIMKESMSAASAGGGFVTGTITSAESVQTGDSSASVSRSGATMTLAPALTRTTAAGAPSSTSAGPRLRAASVLQWSVFVVVFLLSR